MADRSRLLLSIANVIASQIYEGEQTVVAQGELSVTLLSHRLDPSTPPESDLYGTNQSSSLSLSHGPDPGASSIYLPTGSASSEKLQGSSEDDVFLYLAIGQNQF